MALMNRHLTGVETVFLPGDPAFQHVSSSLVKEVAGLGGDVTDLVPERCAPGWALDSPDGRQDESARNRSTGWRRLSSRPPRCRCRRPAW